MWSASSITVTSTASSETWPWPMRSSSRPGQATTTSTPPRRAVTWGFWPTPPNTVREVSPRRRARGVMTSSICVASSRVGARMSARGRRGRRGVALPASRARTGSTNAIVFPDPVRPRPRTSRPERESGRVLAWMGVGVVICCEARASTSGVGTPSMRKVWVDMRSFVVPGSSRPVRSATAVMLCRAGLWAAALCRKWCPDAQALTSKSARLEAEGGARPTSLRDLRGTRPHAASRGLREGGGTRAAARGRTRPSSRLHRAIR